MNTRGTLIAATLSLTLLAAAGLGSTATAAPRASVKDAAAKTYIVKTRSVSAASGVASAAEAAGGEIKHVYQRVYPGFSAKLTAAEVEEVTANPMVVSVIADQAVHTTTTQTDPTWGLDRIDQRPTTGESKYSYDTTGSALPPTSWTPGSGRATISSATGGQRLRLRRQRRRCLRLQRPRHPVSGTVGGSTYGVAKAVSLVGVRVLDCGGSGSFAGVIAGIDWVTVNHSGPSVLNMSLAGGGYQPVDDAVAAATAAGVTVVVAAANNDDDACNYSPARAPSAITVGATDDTDTRAWFSNWGACVDLFASGVDVLSASWTADDAVNTISGTSMASPHVAGIVARYRQAHPGDSPAQVTAALLAAATPGVVADPKASPNLLAYAAPSVVAPPVALPGKTVIKKASSGTRASKGVSVTGRGGNRPPAARDELQRHRDPQVQRREEDLRGLPSVRSKKITGLK